MAASSSGAIKAYLEGPLAMGGAQLGIPVYRDQAPANTAMPYLTVDEAVAIVPDKLEDGAPSTVREHITVNVWMQWKNLGATVVGTVQPGGLMESLTLPSAVAKALQGSRLLQSGSGQPATTVYGVLIRSVGPRLLEIDDNVVRVPIWLELLRAL